MDGGGGTPRPELLTGAKKLQLGCPISFRLPMGFQNFMKILIKFTLLNRARIQCRDGLVLSFKAFMKSLCTQTIFPPCLKKVSTIFALCSLMFFVILKVLALCNLI